MTRDTLAASMLGPSETSGEVDKTSGEVDTPRRPWPWPPAPARAAPWIVVLVALGLRLHRLDQDTLWFDEAHTAIRITAPVPSLVRGLLTEAGAPLYYVFLHYWSLVAGDGEVALRLPSALAGAAGVAALHAVGSRMFSREVGLVAAVLAAASPLHVYYSRELRMYSIVALAGLGALWTLHRSLTTPGLRTAVAFAVVMTLGLYLHYYFLFLLPLGAWALLARERGRALTFTALALLLVALGFAPWVPSVLHQTVNGSTTWIADFWGEYPLWRALPWSLESLGPGPRPVFDHLKFATPETLVVASLGLALLVLGAAVVRIVRGHDGGARPLALTLSAVAAPLVLALVVSLGRHPVYVPARYDIIAWGPFCLLAAAVVTRWRRAAILTFVGAWLAIEIVVLVPAMTTVRRMPNPGDMGDLIADLLRQRARPGEAVIFTVGTRTKTQYYLRDLAPHLRLLTYPLDDSAHLGWNDLRLHADPALAAQEAGRVAGGLLAPGPAPLVVWVVAPRSAESARVLISTLEDRGYRRDPRRSDQWLLRLEAAR